MSSRITIANLVRSMTLFAISFVCFGLMWRLSNGVSPHKHMIPATIVVALSAFCGAIAAIFGKGAHGVFWCLITIFFVLPVVGVALLAIFHGESH